MMAICRAVRSNRRVDEMLLELCMDGWGLMLLYALKLWVLLVK